MTEYPLTQLYNLLAKVIYYKLRHNVFEGINFINVLVSWVKSLTFNVKAAPESLLSILVKSCKKEAFVNNLIVLRGDKCEVVWSKISFHNGMSKIVQLLYCPFIPPNCMIGSETLLFNIKRKLSCLPRDNCYFAFKMETLTDYSPRLALSVNINLIDLTHDVDSKVMSQMIKNFMSITHYCHVGDIESIDCKEYSHGAFSKYIFFKINSIIPEETDAPNPNVPVEGFLLSQHTTIYQLGNIQSFIPSKEYVLLKNKRFYSVVPSCPPCHRDFILQLTSWFKPFLQNKINDLIPFFLVSSADRWGTNILLEASAKMLGVNFLQVDCNNLISSTSAQIQANIKNNFKKISSVSPAVVQLCNIELLWNDSEGHDTESLLAHFSDAVRSLSSEQKLFKAVLVAQVQELSEPPAVLRTLVLASSIVPQLTDIQRASAIVWLASHLQMPPFAPDVPEKLIVDTCSYTFGDLRTLLALAKKHWFNSNTSSIIEFEHFSPVLEKMRKVERVVESGSVDWGDVGGVEEVKIAVAQSVAAGRISRGFRRTGILLHGPPGTGKTLLARAVAAQSSAAFIPVKGPELLNMYVGQSEANVRQVFQKARQVSPCILFFDELDSLAPNRGTKSDSASVMDRVVSQLLAEMDSLESSDQVFILAATNRPDLLDPALLRPGRLDKMLYVGPCIDLPSKLQVFKAVTRKFLLAEDLNEEDIMKLLPAEVTGAQFYSICYSAWMNAASELINTGATEEGVIVTVCQRHFESAIQSNNLQF